MEVAGRHQTEIDCSISGFVLTNTQALLESLAHKSGKMHSKISIEIKQKSKMNVTGFYEASFGVRLQSSDSADLFGETSVSKTLNQLIGLLQAKDNKENIINLLRQLSQKVYCKYKNLLMVFQKGDLDVKVALALPDRNYKRINLTRDEISCALHILETEFDNSSIENTYLGELKGIDIKKNTFTFKSQDGQFYSGKIGKELSSDTVFQVPDYVKVRIKETVEINALSQSEKISYELVSIEHIKNKFI